MASKQPMKQHHKQQSVVSISKTPKSLKDSSPSKLKSSTSVSVPPSLDVTTSGRKLTQTNLNQLCMKLGNLTFRELYALPKHERQKLRLTIRQHYKSLYESDPKWIYIITNPAWDGMVKVGVTNDLKHRLTVYNTGSPFCDFRLVAAEYFDNHELYIEEFYLNFHDYRQYGEWFSVAPSVAHEFLTELKSQDNADRL